MWVGEASRCEVLSFAFTPDGATMYTGNDSGCVLAWDRVTRESRELYELLPVHGRRRGIWQLALGADSTRLFVPGDDKIHVLELPEGEPGKHLRGATSALPRANIAPDGRLISPTYPVSRVKVWDTTTLEREDVPGPLGRMRGVVFAAFVENGTRILTFREQDTEAALWDAETGEQVRVLSAGEVWCSPCALSPDARALAARGVSETCVWVYDLPAWTRRATIRIWGATGLAFHPGGRFLAVTDGSREVTLWDTTTGTKVQTWNWRIGDVRGVAFAPDGLTCAVGGMGRFAVFDVDL
jgi:WD40 repeat protein